MSIRKDYSYVTNFLKKDLWKIRLHKQSKRRSFWLRQLRVFVFALRGYDENKCQLRASALTYYTLLSIVPILAMAFGVAKGFGLDEVLQEQLYLKLRGQEEVIHHVISFANSLIENTKGSIIAGVGLLFLFWSSISGLEQIEASFNEIWGIKKGRSFGRKLTDYFFIMTICPLLFIIASSLTLLISTKLEVLPKEILVIWAFNPVIFLFINFLLPFVVIWFLFTFLYAFLPYTKVRLRSALLGGLIAGFMYQIAQWSYLAFQIGANRFGAVYGSFAALPFFLIWLQLSWLIVLFGAEIAFAEQNVETYEFEPDSLKVSHSFKQLLSLKITHMCIKNFEQGKKPWIAEEISHKLDAPIRLVNDILFELSESKVLAEIKVSREETNIGYQPARDINHLTIGQVLTLLDQRGIEDLVIDKSEEIEKIKEHLEGLRKVLDKSTHNVVLKDL